jgi:hypothetical protein
MSEDTLISLLRQAKNALESYLFDECEPAYDSVIELCRQIEAILPGAEAAPAAASDSAPMSDATRGPTPDL